MTKNPIIDARELVTELYPHAHWALLANSTLMGARAAGSDLDIVVMLPNGDPRAPRRESRRFRGWPVELFVHDERTLAHQLTEEFAARTPRLHRMVGTGFALVGHPHEWRDRCARVLAGGPPRPRLTTVLSGRAGGRKTHLRPPARPRVDGRAPARIRVARRGVEPCLSGLPDRRPHGCTTIRRRVPVLRIELPGA